MQATHVLDVNWMGAKVWSNGLVYDTISNNILRVRKITGEVVYTSDFSDLLKVSTEQKIAISPNGKRVYILDPDSNAKTGPVIIDIEKDTKILLDKKFKRAKFISNDELIVITRVGDDYDTCIINTAGDFVRNTHELESYGDFSLSFGPIRILGYSGPYGKGSGYHVYDERKPTLTARTHKVIVANEYMGKFEKVNPSFLAATSFNDKTYIVDMKTNLVQDTIEARTSAYPSTKYTGFLCDGYTLAMYYDSKFTAKVDLYDLRKKAVVKTITLVDIDLNKERVKELVPLMHRMGFCLNIHIKGKGDLVRVYNLGVQPSVVYEEINGLSWRRIYSDGSILTDATFYNPVVPDINNIINLASRNDIISDQASLEDYLYRIIKCMAAEVGLY